MPKTTPPVKPRDRPIIDCIRRAAEELMCFRDSYQYCGICMSYLNGKRDYDVHINCTKHTDNLAKMHCHKCNVPFESEYDYMVHSRSFQHFSSIVYCKDDNTFKCHSCGRMSDICTAFIGHLNSSRHQKMIKWIGSGSKLYRCKKCDNRAFFVSDELKNHEKNVHQRVNTSIKQKIKNDGKIVSRVGTEELVPIIENGDPEVSKAEELAPSIENGDPKAEELVLIIKNGDPKAEELVLSIENDDLEDVDGKNESIVSLSKDSKAEKLFPLIANGDPSVLVIGKILKKSPFKEVVQYGYTMSKYDMFVKYHGDDFYKAMHICPLLKNSDNLGYRVHHKQAKINSTPVTALNADTLIVGVDDTLKKFCTLRLKDFGDDPSVYCPERSIITDEEILRQKLFVECSTSVSITNIIDTLSVNQQKETKSMERFDIMCRSSKSPKLIYFTFFQKPFCKKWDIFLPKHPKEKLPCA